MARTSAREKILDALSRVVVRDGVGAATLDAVCAEAGVSKGGLLYHFPSREALFGGLHDRLLASIDEAVADAPVDRDALIDWYVRNPTLDDTESAIYAAFIAAARADASGDIASAQLVELFDRFFAPLWKLGEPELAAHVQVIADGLFLRAILGMPLPDDAARTEMIRRLTDS